MSKDLENVVTTVQEYFDDEFTRETMNLIETIALKDGIKIFDLDGNKFKITVEQI
jgi:hypothetical protein